MLEPVTAKRPLRIWIWLVPLLFAIPPAYIAWNWSLAVPHADHWPVVVAPWLKWQDGASFWHVLNDQMNDSRLDAPRFVHLLLATVTGMSTRVESLVCVFLAVCSAWLFMGMVLRRSRDGDSTGTSSFSANRVTIALALLCAAIWLTPDQSMNWMFGVQICYMLVTLMGVMVVAIFQTSWPLAVRVCLGAAAALVGTFSFVVGWAGWGLGFACLLWEGRDGRWRKPGFWISLAVWTIFTGATALFYFYFNRYTVHAGAPVEQHSLVATILAHPWDYAKYFLTLLGMPLAKAWPGDYDWGVDYAFAVAPWVAAAALALFAGVWWSGLRGTWKDQGYWVFPFALLALWSLAAAGGIAVARSGVNLSNPHQDRYLAYTLWFHLGLIVLLFSMRVTMWAWVRRGWLALILVAYVMGAVRGWDMAKRDEGRYNIMAASVSLRKAAPEPIHLDSVAPHMGPIALEQMDILEKQNCLRVPTVQSELVSEAHMAKYGPVLGAIKTSRVENGVPQLSLWAVDKDHHDWVDAVVISTQKEGEPERWLGMGQRRLKNPSMAEKYGVHVPDDRLGWAYVYGTGLDKSFLSPLPNPFRPKDLPKGKVTFRAYAFDVETGTFTPLKGEAVLDIP